jgi:hypothetical protein
MAHKAEAVLEALAAASPAELAGAVSLRALHARCLALGMPAVADAASDVQRLHDLFDLALASNLVSVVVHYVLEARFAAPPTPRSRSPLRRPRETCETLNECTESRRALPAPRRCAWTRWRSPARPPART